MDSLARPPAPSRPETAGQGTLPFPQADGVTPALVPGQKLAGRLAGVYTADGGDGFVTARADELDLTLEGIPGDVHAGWSRKSGSREPWYQRGTIIRSRRQLSILSPPELAAIAAGLGVAEMRAEWLGGNLVVEGVPQLTFLPAGTRLHFDGGAVILVEHMNRPCRHAGAIVARAYPDRTGLDLAFVPVAKRLRGVLASVEHAGRIRPGEAIQIVVPEQWIYEARPGATG